MSQLKSKFINKETTSYLFFGVLTTAVDFILYTICKSLNIHYLAANVIAWCGAVLFAYITNKIYVFKSNIKNILDIINEFTAFTAGRVFSLVFSLIFIYTTVTFFGFHDLIAKILSSVFVIVINYFISKYIVFPSKNHEELKNRGILNWMKDNFCFIVSFAIPMGILIAIYKVREIYPFGDNMYLRSDCYHQYAPFHMKMYEKIMNGESMAYSWDVGLGSNFMALYAYYLATPVNWFLGLFSKNHIIEVMNIFIIVKTCLCSVTFSYYISRHFNSKKLLVSAMGVFYALSSYFAAFSWNLMWLDCLVLLPLIILGLEALVKENKYYLYCISLGVAILSNYYIGIMLCIYCVLYFFALLYTSDEKKDIRFFLIKIKNFAIFSLLAGGFAAITILPAFQALSSTDSGNFNFPKDVANYFSVFEMLSRSLMNVEASIFNAHEPNLYCTIAVFLLIPLYIMNPKVKFKEKAAKMVLVGVFLVSFNTNIPNYIWHGFHFPNSLPARQSFIYIFLLLTMCYEALHYIREVTTKQVLSAFGLALLLFLCIEHFFVGETYSFMIIYLSVTFLVFYTFAILMLKNGNYRQNIVMILLLIIVTAEAYVNTEETALSTSTRSAYLEDNKDITEMITYTKEHDEDLFYRTEKYNRRTKNDAAWIGYHGASIFSSTTNAGVSEFYGALGFEESTNAYAYYGYTPLTESMLSIKYVISNSQREDTEFCKRYTESGDYYLYQNQYTLPLGFMIPANVDEEWDLSRTNPFEVQNSFVSLTTKNPNLMFTRLSVDDLNQVVVAEDTHFHIYVTTSVERIKVTITKPDGNTSTKSFSSMKHRHILDVGQITAGSIVRVESDDPAVSAIQYYAYSYDEQVFIDTYHTLAQQGLKLTSFDDTRLTGTIDVKEDGWMFTSIPYDFGWEIYVDGKEVPSQCFENAFLAVELPKGSHEIVMKYHAPGLRSGMVMSLGSILIFLAIFVMENRKRLKNTSLEQEA